MATALPDGLAQQLRSVHLLVVVPVQLLPDSLLQQPVEDEAAGMPKDHSRRFLLKMEKVQALAQKTVVVFIQHDSKLLSKELPMRAEHEDSRGRPGR